MNIALDVDGTVDAFPAVFDSLAAALEAAGHKVYVITGVEADTVTQADVEAKQGYLKSLGFTAYTAIYVCPTPHDTHKADLVKQLDIALLIDNSKANVKAVAPEAAALLLWNNKE